MIKNNSKTILIVEDERDIRFTLKDFLELEGYDVLMAENGSVAMDILADSVSPCLILLDMKMPVMNGWSFAEHFTEKYDHSTPIVVMTAAADAEQRAKDINAAGWVEKPFNLEMLIKKIKLYEKQTK